MDYSRAVTTLRWDPLAKAKELSAEARSILEAVGAVWKLNMMPNHFQPFAMGKYGYRPRTFNYMKRRAPAGMPRRPLVWTGALRAAAWGGRIGATGANKCSVRLLFHGGFPERREELFRQSEDERTRLMRLVQSALISWFARACPDKPIQAMGAGG